MVSLRKKKNRWVISDILNRLLPPNERTSLRIIHNDGGSDFSVSMQISHRDSDKLFPYVPRKKRTRTLSQVWSSKSFESDGSLSPFRVINDEENINPNTPEKTDIEEKKERKKREKLRNIGPTIDMPTVMRERIEAMGGYGIDLLIQKILTPTDMSQKHGRLSLPKKKLLVDLLLTEEEEVLMQNSDNDKKKKGMTVRIFDSDLNKHAIYLNKWKMGSKRTYCFMTEWNSFVKEMSLESGDEIQIWRFRIPRNEGLNHSNLCFAFIRLPRPMDDREDNVGDDQVQ